MLHSRIYVNGAYRRVYHYSASCLGEYIEMPPGNYTIQIMHLGNEAATGSIIVTKRSNTSQPLKEWIYGGGLRIKRISHHTKETFSTPAKELNYNYQLFSNNNKSSGEIYDGYLKNFLTGSTTQTQICYKNVTIHDTENNGYIQHTYESYFDTPNYQNNYLDYFPNYQNYYAYKKGLLKKVDYFNSLGNVLKSTQNEYEFEELNTTIYASSVINLSFLNFMTKPTWAKLVSSETSDFLNGSSNLPLKTKDLYSYNSVNHKISTQSAINSKGENFTSKYYYHTGNSIHSKNRISEIEKIETYRGQELLNTSKINYVNTFAGNVSYLPETIQASKGSGALENKLRYVLYDEFSNPLQVQSENGMKISYIWGYNKTQPVAKLENIAYSSIPTSLITAIQNATNSTTATQVQIITALNALRTSTDVNLQKAMITTLTYKPLIGVSTMTDAKGQITTYDYDSFGRLQRVKDHLGNILSENEYHYRTQN